MDEERIVTLEDEDGNEGRFEHLDTFELNDTVYVALVSADDEESDEVVLLKLVEDEQGELLLPIEDEDEADTAFEEFKIRMQDEFDFVEEE